MAGPNDIKIGLEIQSNTDEETASAKKLNQALKNAAETAQQIKIPALLRAKPQQSQQEPAQAAPVTGYKAVAAKAAQPSPAMAGAGGGGARPPTGGSSAQMSEGEYGALRGTAGATGASARDFAKQAEGLSGLVRLYAIYAANLYAVGAAFRALSSAMDTTNMIKGLDQLGASSGVALGALSKQLAQTTGNAISLREAMEATAKSTAAGLSSQNVLRLGAAATKASQALGVDITDAVSRLSRGITKLEPELLDELGIFVRIDDVVAKYAQSVGKATGSLTDFERRQAFANAVLDQAEKKFGDIKIDTNPYNTLLATLKDLSQTLLETVNTALGPLIKLLASSPAALLGIISTLGVTLVKQAIPAIGQFRQELQSAANTSKIVAAERATTAIDAQQRLNNRIQALNEEAAENKVAAISKAEERILNLQTNNLGKIKGLYSLLEPTKDITKVSDTRLNRLETVLKGRQAQGRITGEEASAGLEGVETLRNLKTAQENYFKTGAQLRQELDQQAKGWGTLGQTIKISEAAQRKATSDMIVSNAAMTGSTLGVTTAFKLMQEQIKAENLTGFAKGMTTLRGAFALVTGAAATFLNGLSLIFQLVGIVTSAVGFLYAALSNTAKESKATSESLDAFNDSAKNVDATLANINKKPFLEQLDAKSTQAKANALAGLGDSLAKVFETSTKEIKAMSETDMLIDWVKMLWGGDVESKLQKTVSTGITKVFKTVSADSSSAKEAKATIQKLLGGDVDVSSVESVEKALSKLGSKDKLQAITAINSVIQDLGKQSQTSAAKITELDAAFVKVAESRRKVQTDFVPKDTFSQYGLDLIDAFYKLDVALKDPEQKINAIITLSKQLGDLPVPRELVQSMENIGKQAENLQYVTAELNNIDGEIEKLQGLIKGKDLVIGIKTKTIEGKTVAQITEEIERLKERKDSLGDVKVNIITSIESEQKKVDAATLKVYETGSQVISSRLAAEWAKAGATVTNAIATLLDGTQTGIRLRAQAERAVINGQIQQIRSQQALILATEENSIVRERANILEEKALLKAEGTNAELPPARAAMLVQLEKRQEQVDKYRGGRGAVGGSKDYSEGVKQLAELGKEGTAFRISMESSQAAVAQLTAQLQAVNITELSNSIKLEFENEKKVLEARINTIALERGRLANSKELNSELNIEGIRARQRVEEAELQVGFEVKRLALRTKIALAEKAPKTAARDQEINTFKAEINILKATQETELANRKLLNAKEEITANAKIQIVAENDKYVAETRSLALQTQMLDTEQKQLEFKKNSGALAERDYIQAKSALDLAQVRLAQEKELSAARKDQTLALIEQDAAQKRIEEDTRARVAQQTKAGTLVTDISGEPVYTAEELKALENVRQERERINSTYATTVAASKEVYNNTTNILTQQAKLALYQDEWNTKLAKTQELATVLGETFGKIGGAIGGMAVSIQNLTKTQQDYNKKIEEQATIAQKAKEDAQAFSAEGIVTPEALAAQKRNEDAQKRGLELTKEQKDAEILGNAKIIGSAKMMFKEKTVGYKAMAALEKALTVTYLINNLMKMKSDTVAAGTSVTKSLLAAEAAATEAIAKAFGMQPAPVGLAAGAAMIAVMAALLGSAFKKPSTPKPTLEQKQEVQGTAMSWKIDGNNTLQKVQTSRGVLGDPNAKLNSIDESLQVLRSNSVDGLGYNNQMVKHLENIDNGINRAASNVAGKLYNANQPFLGVTPGVTERGLSGKQGVSLGLLGGAAFGLASGASFMASTLIAGPIGAAVGLLIAAFSYKKVTTTIKDSGIKIKGSFDELASDVNNGAIQYFTDVSTTTKRLWGSRTRDNRVTELIKENDPISQLFEMVFQETKKTFILLGREMGKSGDEVSQVLKKATFDFEISLKDLKGEELANALKSGISTVLASTAEALFPELERFAKLGEDAYETVVRVLDTNKKIEQSLKNVGFEGITEILNKTGVLVTDINGLPVGDRSFDPKLIRQAAVEITEGLADIYGGVDKYVDANKKYVDNFKTSAQKLEIYRQGELKDRRLAQEALAKAGLGDIDLSAVRSRQELDAVYQRTLAKIGTTEGREAEYAVNMWSQSMDRLLPKLEDVSESDIINFFDDLAKKINGVEKEIKRFGMNDYELAVAKINDETQTLIDNYAKMGIATEENNKQILAYRDAQLELLDLQMGKKVTDMLTQLGTELYDAALSPFAKGIADITRKAKTYGDTLINNNRATDENIKALEYWETKMVDSAVATERAAQESKIDKMFAGTGTFNKQFQSLADKFNKLGRLLPKSNEDLKEMITSITGTDVASLGLRSSLIELGEQFQTLVQQASDTLNKAYTDRVTELKSARDQFSNFAKTIRDFKTSLLTGTLTTLTPAQQYQVLKDTFNKTVMDAKAGNIEAMNSLQSVSQQFLESSRGMFASSEMYTRDFEIVKNTLDDTQTFAELQIELAEKLLAATNESVRGILTIAENTQATTISINETSAAFTQALANYNTAMQVTQTEIDTRQTSSFYEALENNKSEIEKAMGLVEDTITDIFTKEGGVNSGLSDIKNKANLTAENVSAMNTAVNNSLDKLLAAATAKPASSTSNVGSSGVLAADIPFTGTTNPLAGSSVGAVATGMFDPRFFAPIAVTQSFDSAGEVGLNQTGGALISGDMYWAGDSWEKLPSRAMGSNFVPQDMAAYIHKGERIMPAADNRKLMEYLDQPQQTNSELQEEVRRLTKQVETLTQVVAEGAIANARATAENTAEITNAIKQTSDAAVYNQKIQSRTSIA